MSLACSLNCSWAQERADTPEERTTQVMDPVVVSASRRDSALKDMPLHTSIITQEDIQTSSAQTLDQLLRTLPGLNFTGVPSAQTDPTGQSSKMRGLGNAKVLVLMDGIPVMDPFYLTTQWFKIPLTLIQRIEVIRGGNSSLWGNMAVAGVINVVSKTPQGNSDQWDVSMGSRGSSEVALTKQVRVSPDWGLNVYLEELNARGYPMTPVDQAWRYPQKNTIDAKDSNLQVSSFFTPSADFKATFKLGAHLQDQAISYNWGQNLQKSPDLSLSVLKTLAPGNTWQSSFWHQSVDFSKFNGSSCYWQSASSTPCPSAQTLSLAQINNNVVQYYTQRGLQNYLENGASSIYSQRIGGTLQDLQIGVDLRQLKATDQEWFYTSPVSLNSLQNLSSTTSGSGTQTFAGLFAQSKLLPIKALEQLELTLSARLDQYSNTERHITRTATGANTTGGPQEDISKSALNPSIATRYGLDEHTSFRAAAYQSFRAPGFNNTLRTYGSPSPTIANPQLSPETLRGQELGVDFVSRELSVSATYFLYNINHMIATSNYQFISPGNPNNSPFIPDLVQTICQGPALRACGGKASFYSNAQDGRSEGFELTSQWHLKSHVKLEGSLSRTTSVLTNNQVSTAPLGVQVAGLPWNTAKLALDWQINDQDRLYLQTYYIGRMLIDTTSSLGQVYDQGGVSIVNVSFKHRLNKDTDVSLHASNLFNRIYSENAYAYNQPWLATLSEPQTFRLSLRTRF